MALEQGAHDLGVGLILVAAGCLLVRQHCVEADDGHFEFIEVQRFSVGPRVGEVDPVDGADQIDAARGGADLEDRPSIGEIPLAVGIKE